MSVSIAQEKTFVKEYTYNASEMDSKISCRAITVDQLRSTLLQEIGVYVESEHLLKTTDVGGKFSQDFAENIKFLMDDPKCFELDKFLSAVPEEKNRKPNNVNFI